jgi:hypothetical protein
MGLKRRNLNFPLRFDKRPENLLLIQNSNQTLCFVYSLQNHQGQIIAPMKVIPTRAINRGSVNRARGQVPPTFIPNIYHCAQTDPWIMLEA